MFLSLVHSTIKTKPEDKKNKTTTTNINATVLTVGCYYSVREAVGEQKSICERSFISAFFCARLVHFFFFFKAEQFSYIGFIEIAVNSQLGGLCLHV